MPRKKPIKPLKKQLVLYVIENNVKCAYCGRKYDDVKNKRTVDHVVPKSKGGETSLDNIIICCQVCNNVKKANEDIDEFIKHNKRARENLRKYLVKVEDCYINNKSYHKALTWVIDLLKREGR